MVQGMLSLPFEHPFATIKTVMQASDKRTVEAIKMIYEHKGSRGFYSGFTLNSLRCMLKMGYRWPLNIWLLDAYRTLFANHLDHNKAADNGLIGMMAGVSLALFQTAIICPLQRIQVWLMTSYHLQTISKFFLAKNITSLFDGISAVGCKQLVSWVSFLGSQEYFKGLFCQKQREMTTQQLISVSICVCLTNTFFVMPVDYIKTHYQKYDKEKVSVFKSIQLRVKQKGFSMLYVGWHIKIIQYGINSLFTVSLFQKLLRQYSGNSNG